MRLIARRRRGLVGAAVIAVTAMACHIGEKRYVEVTEHITAPSTTKTCSPPFAKPDVSSLTACGDGKGHCYDTTKTSLTGIPDCGGGKSCVPDKVLGAGGDKLKSCTFFIGNKPGVCLSLLVSDVAQHKDQLKQDACDEDERCIPCVDPTNGQDTGLCAEVGVYEKACTGGADTSLETCCHGAGVCLKPDAVPSDSQGDLDPDTCHGGNLCAPTSLVNNVPVKCSALGLPGVCLDTCFSNLLRGAETALQGDCQATEVCLPCAVGAVEGVPGC